jgi:CRP/FNR family cyclic AMP-dependent transcriptional regulator
MPVFHEDAKIAALKRSPLFAGLSRRHLEQVARLTDDLEVPAGSVLCKEGAEGHEFFVIVDGEAAVSRDGATVATLGAGDFFGETALLSHTTRTATVTATTPLRFFLVADTAFRGLLDADREIGRRVMATLVARVFPPTGDPETPF